MSAAIAERVDVEAETRDLDLKFVLAYLWVKRWWIVLSIVLTTALFVVIAMNMEKIYRGTAVLVPAGSERPGLGDSLGGALGSLGGLASVAGLTGVSSAETEEAIAVLKSRQFSEAFISTRNLMPEFFPKQWDAQRMAWRADTKPPTLAKAFKYFNKIRAVSQDKKTGLVTLQIDWRDRVEVADWVNDLVERLNSEMRSRAISKSSASVGYLEKELDSTNTVSTRDAINRLIEGQVKQRMLANVTKEYAFRVVDRAMPGDPDDPVRPNKVLLAAAGPFVGGLLGIALVLALSRLGPALRGIRRAAADIRNGEKGQLES